MILSVGEILVDMIGAEKDGAFAALMQKLPL